MGHHFLQYWKLDIAEVTLDRGGLLNHSASEQLWRIEVGDTLFIVTIKNGALYLLGLFEVGWITDQMTAQKLLGTTDLWEANYHAIAQTGMASSIGYCPVPVSVAISLRFESDTSPSLTIRNGKVDGKQLQAVRELTTHSARSLSSLWSEYQATHTDSR